MSNISKINVDNCDLMENLVPLWEDKGLTEIERVLTYTCVVLNERCINLNNKIIELEKKLRVNSIPTVQQVPNQEPQKLSKSIMNLNLNTGNLAGGSRSFNNNIFETPRKTPRNNNFNPYIRDEVGIENNRKKHSKDKKSSKRNMHEIKRSIRDVKKTLEEIKKSSRKQ